MSKPILWLGPLEELDVDYDPLLGRSATLAVPKATFSAPKAAFDPSRSVFDDPVEEPTFNAPAPAALPLARNPKDSGDDPPLETGATIATADIDPTLAQPGQPQPTDFTHNNEPIPTRQKPAITAYDAPQQAPSPSGDTLQEPISGKKSFFANLFSKREIAPHEMAGGASINEIWAKAAEPQALPEPDPEPILVSEPVAETRDEDASDPMPERLGDVGETPSNPEAPSKPRNIWADIEDEVIAPEPPEPLEPTPLPIPLAETEAFVTPAPNHSDAELAADIVISEDIPVISELPEPLFSAPENDPEIDLEPSEENDVPLQPDALETETIVEPDAEIALNSVDEASRAPNFQNAFNADKFWAIPTIQKPSAPTDALAETATVAPFDVPDLSQKPSESSGEAMVETSDVDTQTRGDANLDAVTPQAAQRPRASTNGKRRKKKVKKNYIGAFVGTFLFGVAALMTAVSTAAPFGYPFDMVSSYRWYWVILAVVAAGIWGLTRGWKMVIASFAVMGVNLFVTVPATGNAPSGGNNATAVIGWANVAGNTNALSRVFKDADKKKATLLMLAEAPQSVFAPPAGWTLIEAPIAGDPTAIAVLSKTNWRAATVPGEPTIARPPSGELTILGVHPHDANKGRRRTPMRDALINRAGTRAGIQDGPTVVLGDFNAAPWDSAMGQFREYGNVTRVRCGGWAGATLTQAFGLIGVATDHAFVRDVTVAHCQLGASLTGGNHRPIWLYVAPKPPEASDVAP